jgi:hypothetical protein
MHPHLPPIYRDARRLLLHTEQVVQRFSRYHKYTVGADLRTQAMRLMRGVHRAVYDKANQARHVQDLVWQVDDYKITLQLGQEVGAFMHGLKGKTRKPTAAFAAFEAAALLAASIGKQCGGWQQASTAKASKQASMQAHKASQEVKQEEDVVPKSATSASSPATTALSGGAGLQQAPRGNARVQASPFSLSAAASA